MKIKNIQNVILKVFFVFSLLYFIEFSSNKALLASSNFIKYSNNPIIRSEGYQQTVVLSNNNFKMWFTFQGRIYLATSNDGFNWNLYSNNPVLLPDGNSNEEFVVEPKVIYDEGIYKMWYTAVPSSRTYYIRYATSTDGINWTKSARSVNIPRQSWEGPSRAYPNVLKVGSEYKMWYTSNDGRWKISYATSNDGFDWIPYSGNPVIFPNKPWEGNDVAGATVLYDGSKYEMFYASGGNIAYATSIDGINWEKPSDKNPALSPSGGWDTNEMSPSAVKLENNTILLY
ncbi:MAG: hypothetical protein N3A54_04375, partial [Patescibacteria group bacterium]|nr:hypothetical protein [Patescibacteria group bacterium]